jgi:hypothetical protein
VTGCRHAAPRRPVQWSDAAAAHRRAAAETGCAGLEREVAGMSSLVVASVAGLSSGNADTLLVADLPGPDAFGRYTADPVDRAVLDEHVRP